MLRDAAPGFLWVGLGTPKQETFLAHLATTTEVPFGVAARVSAAFDFLTGRGRQAPPRVRALGLEWLWRLAHEPRRLGRCFLVTAPGFTFRVAAQTPGLPTLPLGRLACALTELPLNQLLDARLRRQHFLDF